MNVYFFYSKILEEISTHRCNYKSLILSRCQSKGYTSSQIKRTYSIIINSHKNLSSLQEILNNLVNTYPDVKISNSWLFLILLHEFFREQQDSQGKTRKSILKGGGYLIRMIKKHKDFLINELNTLKIPLFSKNLVKSQVYIRLIKNRSDIHSISREINSKLEGISLNITLDKEIPNLISLDYESYSKAFCNETGPVTDRKDIIIQGKSSCYPVWVLMKSILAKTKEIPSFLNKCFDVIDACAAPGNKTLQLSEYLQNFKKTKLLVFERNFERFQLLEKRLNEYDINMKNTLCFHKDFLDVDWKEDMYKDVKLMLLDPSCSGSGMKIQLFYKENEEISKDFEKECKIRYETLDFKEKQRILNLQAFQLKMLLHAMKFPNILRICYSTCSIFKEEDEIVVQKALESNNTFKLVNLSKKIKGLNKGFGKFGKRCLRANPFNDATDGFFIALFKRKKIKS